MKLQVLQLEATCPQGSVQCTQTTGTCLSSTPFLYTFTGQNVNYETVLFQFTSNFSPLSEDSDYSMTEAVLTVNGEEINLQLHNTPTLTIDEDEYTLVYTDCVLTLNGTNGTITVRFKYDV